MKTFKINDTLDNVPTLDAPINLCLGYFDGVHIAHQKLITKAINHDSHMCGVITFSDNLKARNRLTSLSDRLTIFKELKVDYVYVLPFTNNIKKLSPDDFIAKFLKKINIANLFCGEDYRFGINAKGDTALLKQHFNTYVIPFFKNKNKKISSNQIIELLKKGEIQSANALLGRPYEIQGKIVRGYQIGRTISFPTANIKLNFDYVIPRLGVYKTVIYVNGIPHISITNVGVHPTIKKLKKPSIETHILNFKADTYAQNVYLDFIKFIRDEKEFTSLTKLAEQIQKDIKEL